MNLIENDQMWINCMDEAINLYTATSWTNLLIAILCENEVANPQKLFDRYHEFLMKDFLYRRQQQQQQHPHEVALDDLLFAIQQGLQMKGNCRILGLTTLNSLLQYVNWMVWEVCSVN